VICDFAANVGETGHSRRTHPGREVDIAQKVTVALIDDLDGGPAEETIRFGIEGAEYEIDLSGKNARDAGSPTVSPSPPTIRAG
jgi:hypothetical protein